MANIIPTLPEESLPWSKLDRYMSGCSHILAQQTAGHCNSEISLIVPKISCLSSVITFHKDPLRTPCFPLFLLPLIAYFSVALVVKSALHFVMSLSCCVSRSLKSGKSHLLGALLLEEVITSCGMEGLNAVIDTLKRRISESQEQKESGAPGWWRVSWSTTY